MSLPALRKPKSKEPKSRKIVSAEQFIILTLKNSVKLVISSDCFHCIITMGEHYRCVICNANMDLHVGDKEKENHKNLQEHQRLLKVYPYLEDLAENLIRKIDNSNCYCTICNVITSTHYLMRHIKTDEHMHELNKAILRATTYKPDFNNNNK